jgi:anaerobic magnesium-protoporphyrin IX monomethyl ester cyclase
MKIVLINPAITSAERYGEDIGAIGGHQAPLGICYLAAFLEKNGYAVSLIDAEAEGLDNGKVLNKIRAFRPDAVGITSTTVAFQRARDLALDIKRYDSCIPIIIGGSHVTANPRETLVFECFDYGVVKEGEITLFELLKALEDNRPSGDMQGLVYRKAGEVIISPMRPYIRELDLLPFPARHLLSGIKRYLPPLGSYIAKPVVSMMTSRGCPYQCIFCDNNVFGRNVRYHSPAYVASEIENVVDAYGAREIFFLDDTFTVNKERTRGILSLLRKKNLKIRWTCMTRASDVDRELLKEMKEAGCWQISIGVESGNQKVLDFIKKGIKLEGVENVVKWSYEAGIYVKGFFMLGHPIDTPRTIDETINFAKSNPFSDVVVTITTPIPGTELYSMARRYGTLRDDDWSKFSYWKPVFVPHGLTEDYLYKKQRQFYAGFYLRPGIISRQIKKIRSISQLSGYAISIVKIIFQALFVRSRESFTDRKTK